MHIPCVFLQVVHPLRKPHCFVPYYGLGMETARGWICIPGLNHLVHDLMKGATGFSIDEVQKLSEYTRKTVNIHVLKGNVPAGMQPLVRRGYVPPFKHNRGFFFLFSYAFSPR